MRRVIHLIPYDGIGGVERAAATVEGKQLGDLILERVFIFENVRDRTGRTATFNPQALWAAAGRLARSAPDLVILSLWRSVLVGWLARMRGCRAPMVLFLHNARDAHFLDRMVTRLAARGVVAVWADSTASLQERIPQLNGVSTRVISYLLDRPSPARGESPDPAPNLIFWGRLTAQKEPQRMLAVFAEVYARHPDATFTVIGPDGGQETALRLDIARRGLEHAVRLVGPLSREKIASMAAHASFYLQTSRYEGMAISVMEAMQLGLVPVVTPVGEIARYTRDGHSAIWIAPNDSGADAARSAAERVNALVDDPAVWRRYRDAAVSSLVDLPLYSEDLLAAATETLDGLAHGGRRGCR